MTPRKDLLNLFRTNTGKTTISPKQTHPSMLAMTGYQMPRINKFRWQGKVE